MRPRRRAGVAVLAIAAGAFGLVGCTGGSAGPLRAGTLRVAVLGSVTLDPAQAGTADQRRQVALVFEPLVRLDRLTRRPQPGLAARWKASDDETRITITLRS